MAASITDLQNELEAINASMQTMVGIQTRAEAIGRAGAGTPGGGMTGQDKSFFATQMKLWATDPKGAIVDAGKNALKIGYQLVEQVDSLIMNNLADGRNTLNIFRDMKEEQGHQYGGILQNIEMATTAQEKGLPLYGSMNKRLRNQLTELDKQGAQGRLLLNHIKELTAQGFKHDEVQVVIQRLADIGYYSIQSANSQSAMLRQMTRTAAITGITDPAFGKNITNVLTDFMMDAPDWAKREGAARLQEIILPQNMEQLMLRGQLGLPARLEELKALTEENKTIREIGKAAKEAGTAGGLKIMEDNLATNTKEIEKLVMSYSRDYSRLLSKTFEGMSPESTFLVGQESYFKEQLDQSTSLNNTMAGMEAHWATQADRAAHPERYAGKKGMVGAAAEEQWALTEDNLGRMAEIFQQKALNDLEGINTEIKTTLLTVVQPLFTGTLKLAQIELKIAEIAGALIAMPINMTTELWGAFQDATGTNLIRDEIREQGRTNRSHFLMYGVQPASSWWEGVTTSPTTGSQQ